MSCVSRRRFSAISQQVCWAAARPSSDLQTVCKQIYSMSNKDCSDISHPTVIPKFKFSVSKQNHVAKITHKAKLKTRKIKNVSLQNFTENIFRIYISHLDKFSFRWIISCSFCRRRFADSAIWRFFSSICW